MQVRQGRLVFGGKIQVSKKDFTQFYELLPVVGRKEVFAGM